MMGFKTKVTGVKLLPKDRTQCSETFTTIPEILMTKILN